MTTLDEEIARNLRESEAAGELRAARFWGRPLDLTDGYATTPTELRMAYKVLKNAGMVPPEVELMQQAGALREEIAAMPDGPARQTKRQRLSELQQFIALRLERLRLSGTL